MGKYPVDRILKQTFVQQERFDNEEVYIKDHLEEWVRE